MVRIAIVAMLVLILASLGSALYYMMKDRSGTSRTVNALTLRVGLSVVLFLLLILGHRLGWIPANS
jgi:hypothetical protein